MKSQFKTLTKRENLIFCIVVGLGGFLRFFDLGGESLWLDELSSVARAQFSSISKMIERGVLTEFHPPGYHFLTYILMKTFGTSETILRLPSAIAGTLSLIVFIPFSKMVMGKTQALYAVIFLSFLFPPIYYSQEHRTYSVFLLLTLCASFFFFKLFTRISKNSDSLKSVQTIFLFSIFSALSSYFHYFGIPFFGMVLLTGLIFFQKHSFSLRLKYMGLALIIYLILMSPWVPSFILQLQIVSNDWIQTPDLKSIWSNIRFYFGGSSFLAGVAFLIGLGNFLFYTLKKNRSSLFRENFWIFLLWSTLPLFLAILFSFLVQPILVKRYFFFLLPYFFLVLSTLFLSILPLKRTLLHRYSIILSIFLLYSLVIENRYYSQKRKDHFRQTAEFLKNQTDDKAPVFYCARRKQNFRYYFKQLKILNPLQEKICGIHDLKTYLSTFSLPKKFWLIYGHRHVGMKAKERLSKMGTLELKYKGLRAGLYHFRKFSSKN